MNNKNRIGFFTSSQMSRLAATLKSGKPSSAFYTYIDEVVQEKAMNRPINVQVKTQPMKWGSLMEVVLFNLLGIGYKMTHKQTIKHPDSEFSNVWSGTPDLIAENIKTGEIKCFQPNNFSKLSLCILRQNVLLFKESFPKEYWQCVSNSILCGLDRTEIIAYMPYKTELEAIIDNITETNFLELNGLDPQDYYFMSRNDIETLPYLPDDSPMSNINSFEFEIPKEDIEFLTKRVRLASDELIIRSIPVTNGK